MKTKPVPTANMRAFARSLIETIESGDTGALELAQALADIDAEAYERGYECGRSDEALIEKGLKTIRASKGPSRT